MLNIEKLQIVKIGLRKVNEKKKVKKNAAEGTSMVTWKSKKASQLPA